MNRDEVKAFVGEHFFKAMERQAMKKLPRSHPVRIQMSINKHIAKLWQNGWLRTETKGNELEH